MGLIRSTLIGSLVVLLIAVAIQIYWDAQNLRGLEKLEEWAENNKISIKGLVSEKFKIKYNDKEWTALVEKLNNTRYFDEIETEPTFELGFPVSLAKEFVDYWKKDFNWKKQVEKLNRYQHYLLKVDDITLHYYRVSDESKNKNAKRVPLLLLNGWPSTFYEFYDAIDYIMKTHNNDERSFDIVVPSLPGYSYSTPLKKIYDIADMARVFDALMRHLFGENAKYFVHGEDWGAEISYTLAVLYPNRVYGGHVTMVTPTRSISKNALFTTILAELFPSIMLTDEEKSSNFTYSFIKRLGFMIKHSGYFHQQATRPDTLAYGFSDSPVALFAYIIEKYSLGSFGLEAIGTKDGNLNKFSRDDLLTIVSLYWTTNSMPSAMRIYKSLMYQLTGDLLKKEITKHSIPASVPFAIMSHPQEVDHTPYVVLKKIFGNLIQYSIMKTGGHFALFHQPKATSDDLIKFIDSVLKMK